MLLTRAIESADIYHVERAVCKRVFFFWWGGTKLKCLKKKPLCISESITITWWFFNDYFQTLYDMFIESKKKKLKKNEGFKIDL